MNDRKGRTFSGAAIGMKGRTWKGRTFRCAVTVLQNFCHSERSKEPAFLTGGAA